MKSTTTSTTPGCVMGAIEGVIAVVTVVNDSVCAASFPLQWVE